MAPTVIKSPTDVVDFLVSQHQQIKAMFAETLAASGKAREKAFVELRRLLAVHETAEEEIVHPAPSARSPTAPLWWTSGCTKSTRPRPSCGSWKSSTSTARSSLAN